MNIAYHSSDLFAPVVGVSIVSLFENNKDAENIDVYLIEKDISQDNKAKLKDICDKYGRKIFFIPMPDVNKEQNLNLKKIKTEWEFYSYVRLFLDKYLPQNLERVLYLDSDVLITSSLKELWETDLNGHCAAAVKDCLGEKYFDVLDLNEKAVYCNSGVILMDMVQWRKNNMADRIRDVVKKYNGRVFFVEQTVFNTVLQNEILTLDARYNVSTLMQILTYDELYKLRKMKRFYNEDEVKNAVNHPGIIHLTSCFMIHNRPWTDNCNHPSVEIYDKYRNLSPWKDEEKSGDKRSKMTLFKDFLVLNMPKNMLISIVSFIYNTIRVNKIKRERKIYS